MRVGPRVLWWFAPDPRPPDLRERVLRRGFERVEDTAAMAMDLARLPDSVPPPDAVQIEAVDDPAAIDAYVRAVIRSLEIDHWPLPPDAVRNRTDHIRSGWGPTRCRAGSWRSWMASRWRRRACRWRAVWPGSTRW